MNKKKAMSMWLVAISAVFLLGACRTVPSGETTLTHKESDTQGNGLPVSQRKIAIIIPSPNHNWLAGVMYNAEKKCQELGLLEDEYEIYTSDTIEEQVEQIEQAIEDAVSCIVLLPHNSDIQSAAEKINEAGISWVLFDRQAGATATVYVAGDNASMGALCAEYMGEKLAKKGTIAVVRIPSSGSVSSDRVDAFVSVMEEKYPLINLVYVEAADFTQQAGKEAVSELFLKNDTNDAIFSIDDETSMGILQAIDEDKRLDVRYISGGGGAQYYLQLIQKNNAPECLTVTYSPAMIKEAIQAAVDLLDGKDVPAILMLASDLITKQNVDDFIDVNSPY